MATILVGYCLENSFNPEVTRRFVQRMRSVHERLEVPATVFVLGRSVETNVKDLRPLSAHPLFELGQHTYSHIGLKPLTEYTPRSTHHIEGGTLDEVRKDIEKAQAVFKNYLGIFPRGFAAPRGCYQGLSDRPDVLTVLADCGFNYVSSYGRNADGWQPVPLQAQPYWYEAQGYPDLLEIPYQGWQDAAWFRYFGAETLDGYEEYNHRLLDRLQDAELVWAFSQHDWVIDSWDPDMRHTREVIRRARLEGHRLMSFGAYREHKVREETKFAD